MASKVNEKYYVLNLWDYGTPAFVSFDKMYIGTEADIRDAMKSMKKKNADSDTVRALECYYYWSKCEWECVITDTHPHIGQRELDRILDDCYRKLTKDAPPCRFSHVNLSDADKIDVYDQLRLNWDEFVEYVWGFRKPQKSRVKKKPDTINENDAEHTSHE